MSSYWNRFDIVAAYALFFESYHEGMHSEKYRRLSKIRTYYSSSSYADDVVSSENSKEIYENLVENYPEVSNEL